MEVMKMTNYEKLEAIFVKVMKSDAGALDLADYVHGEFTETQLEDMVEEFEYLLD